MNCRVCGSNYFPNTLLSYSDMPSSAQGFPILEGLEDDAGSDLNVFQCSSCGLIQLDAQPVSYFKEVIRAAAFSEEMCDFRTSQFKIWVNEYGLLNKNILEVGCGKGEYLSILNKSGVFAHGVEFSDQAITVCRELGYRVTKGYFGDNDFTLPVSQYDGFICLNFMEHWPDPNQALTHLHSSLKDDAVGLLEVPNFNMILEKNLFSEFIADHLMYFTEDTLTFILQSNGFEVINCSPIWHGYILSAIVKKRTKIDLTSFENCRLKIKNDLNLFIDQFNYKRVAIWGAGHQSLAVISLAEIGGKIKYVVDSASFKQGKYTPATHLPIVAPSTLNSDPVKAVIIMAASYSDEVAKILRENYSNNLKIAILRDYGLEKL